MSERRRRSAFPYTATFDFRSIFAKRSAGRPSIRTMDEFIQRFGGGLPVQIAWECGPGFPCAHALDRASLEMAQRLTEELSVAPGVHRES